MVNHFGPKSNAPRDVLACVKISEVYRALGGPELRRMRGPAFWRDGDGFNVALDDARGVWHDKVADVGGGVLDLIVHARGGNRADALRFAAELAGIPLDDRPLSPAERNRWAQQKRRLELELPRARYWRRAAIEMSEELLTVLKSALFDGPADKIDFDGLRDTTRLLARLQRIDGAELVAEFHSWMESHPQLASAMVQAAQTRETAERRAIQVYVEMNLSEAARA